jgi:cysteine desulfurase
MIYLDYAATTPVDPRVVEKMLGFLGPDSCFANPASRSHMLGWQAEAAVESARKQVASLINADVREIVWTSGATESNNLAIKGGLAGLRKQGGELGERRHIVTSLTEHKAVLDCFESLESEGYEISYIRPDTSGVVTVDLLSQSIRKDTALVSIMHVNNETGVINPVMELGELVKRQGALFHVDAAQSAGKIPLDARTIQADLLSVCAHKIYGPKGVGALFVRRTSDFSVEPLIHGGGHERGMRPGTLASHQLVALGEAFAIAQASQRHEYEKLTELKTRFLRPLLLRDDVKVNGDLINSVPGIINLSFLNKDGQLLLAAMPDLAISSGSACTSANMAPSHVLKAMGVTDEAALGSLRFSFGRFTTEREVDQALTRLTTALDKL